MGDLREWVQAFLDDCCAGEAEKCAAFFAEDGYMDDVGLGHRADGRAAIARFLSQMSASSDTRFQIESFLSDGEQFALQWQLSGTDSTTGERGSVRGASLGELHDGLITRWSDYWNPPHPANQGGPPA